jgi:hypothetical protein
MQKNTFSMNVSDMSEDELDEAVSDALHDIVKTADLWEEKKAFHKEVTNALFDLLNERDLTIFDVQIKRDEKVCPILDEPMRDIPEGKLLEGPIDVEKVKICNVRVKDTAGNFELLYEREFKKDIKLTLYTQRKRIKM